MPEPRRPNWRSADSGSKGGLSVLLQPAAKVPKASNPPLTYASIGAGSRQQMSMEFAKKRFGFEATHGRIARPHSSPPTSPPATSLRASWKPGLDPADQGRETARAGGVGVARLPLLPDVPPFSEASGAPDYEGVSWHMLLMPAKTPRPIADRLHTEMKRIRAAPDMREKIAAVGLIPNNSPSIEEMRGYIASEHVKWGALVKQLGLEGSQ